MSTIVIETTEPSRRFEIDLEKEPREFVLELREFVSKLESRSKPKRNGTRRELSEEMRRASAYIDSIADRPQSKAALAEADELRRGLLRKYD